MAKNALKYVKTFASKDADGKVVNILYYLRSADTQATAGASANRITGFKLATGHGHNVVRRSKGIYEVLETRQILTLADQDAP